MNDRIRNLLNQMTALEDEMRTLLHDQETKMFFEIKGRRIEFEKAVKQSHRKLKKKFFRWLVTNRPQNLLTGPIIYGMIIPMMMLDLFVSFYQAACFPIYGVVKVRRRDYIVFDRHQLEYLNFIEKFHCPIKHAHKIHGTHKRYLGFLDYGDAADYEKKLEAFRVSLGKQA